MGSAHIFKRLITLLRPPDRHANLEKGKKSWRLVENIKSNEIVICGPKIRSAATQDNPHRQLEISRRKNNKITNNKRDNISHKQFCKTKL